METNAYVAAPGPIADTTTAPPITIVPTSPAVLASSIVCTPAMSHPIPDPTRLADPNRVRDATLYTGTHFDMFFFRAKLVPVVMQTISVITKIIFIYNRITIEVVSINIYTHILSPIYLYMYIFFSNTKHQRSRKQCGEHLSLSWPALLMWDVLSSILVFCFCTYTD